MKKNNTIKFLLKENIIEESEIEIISYGIEQGKVILLSFVVSLALGILLDIVGQCIIFVVSLVILRSYAGGYHATTRFKCGVISFAILILCLLIMKFFYMDERICILFASFSIFLIYILSPMENNIKRLDNDEIVFFRKRTRQILWSIYIFIILGSIVGTKACIEALVMAMITVDVLLVMGWIKNRRTKKQEK